MRSTKALGCLGLVLAFLMTAIAAPGIDYTYDGLNRLTKVVYDDGTTISYVYDPAGNLLSRTVTEGQDMDGDGVPYAGGANFCTGGETSNCEDNCPTLANADQADQDGDGVGDLCDSCVEVPNPRISASGTTIPRTGNQSDSDGDGIGNQCDCDFDQTGACNIADFSIFRTDFQSTVDSGVGTDMDGNGAVSIADFSLFRIGFSAAAPGPSCAACPMENLP